MRNASRLLLVASMAIAAMALGASSASALTATNESGGGTPCGAISITGTNVTGGCLVHATSEGEVELRKHVFGIESHITTCKNEFWGRVSGTATGYIMEQSLTQAGPLHKACNRVPCKAASGESYPWGSHTIPALPAVPTPSPAVGVEGASQEAGDNEYMTINFCVMPAPSGTFEQCEIDVPFQETVDHRVEFGHATELSSHGISGFRCELIGHWQTEASGAVTHDGNAPVFIEVNH